MLQYKIIWCSTSLDPFHITVKQTLKSSCGTVGLPEQCRISNCYTNFTLALSGRMDRWGGRKTARAGCITGIFLSCLHKVVLRNDLKFFVESGKKIYWRTPGGICLDYCCCCQCWHWNILGSEVQKNWCRDLAAPYLARCPANWPISAAALPGCSWNLQPVEVLGLLGVVVGGWEGLLFVAVGLVGILVWFGLGFWFGGVFLVLVWFVVWFCFVWFCGRVGRALNWNKRKFHNIESSLKWNWLFPLNCYQRLFMWTWAMLLPTSDFELSWRIKQLWVETMAPSLFLVIYDSELLRQPLQKSICRSSPPDEQVHASVFLPCSCH